MSDLNELFKVLSEGKKDYEQNNTVGKKVKEAKDHVKEDLNSLFEQLASLHEELIVVESKQVIQEEVLVQPIPVAAPDIETYPVVEKVVPGIEKYLTGESFQQPNPDLVSKDVEAIRSKIKFLEQAIGKIAATGPGSGEVNFRWLDDVDRASIGNTDQVLRYNPTTKKFFFGQLSGDQGQIRSLTFDSTGAGVTPTPGMLDWNRIEDCLNIHQADGSVCQVGLEHYIQVRNTTGATLLNGTVVRFSGLYTNEDHVPTCEPHIADGTVPTLYLIGVLTNDIPNNSTGRATVFGKVREINTSGSDVGETWLDGDLLWVHPTIPGKMTKVQPTAPNVVTSIAVVLHANINGDILVRPTFFPRLYYANYFSTQDQSVSLINTATPITVNNVDITSGFVLENGSHIKALNSGLYNFQFSLQVTSSNSSVKYFWIWPRKNGVDIPNSATKLSISSNTIVLAPAWNFIVSMQSNDYFQLMWAADSVDVHLSAPAATAFCPATPSVLLSVNQVNL